MIQSSDLAWIVVSDINRARKFFTETIGLKEHVFSEEHFWAELGAEKGGSVLGIAQENPEMKAGSNAVVTFTVDNLDSTLKAFKDQKVDLIGEVMEIPGHVKMQLFRDVDGNLFQLVEKLD